MFNTNMITKLSRIILVLLIATLSVVSIARGQDPPPAARTEPAIDEKSQLIINKAIEVLGGSAYLSVTSVVGKGFFSPFHEGAAMPPARFLDYIVYPDRERTEFSGSGIKT